MAHLAMSEQTDHLDEFLELYQERFIQRATTDEPDLKIDNGGLSVGGRGGKRWSLDSLITIEDFAHELTDPLDAVRGWVETNLDDRLKKRNGVGYQVRAGAILLSSLPLGGKPITVDDKIWKMFMKIHPEEDADAVDFIREHFASWVRKNGEILLDHQTFLNIEYLLRERWVIGLYENTEERTRDVLLVEEPRKIYQDYEEPEERKKYDVRLRRALMRLDAVVPKGNLPHTEEKRNKSVEEIINDAPEKLSLSIGMGSAGYRRSIRYLVSQLNVVLGVPFGSHQMIGLMKESGLKKEYGKAHDKNEVLTFYRRALKMRYNLTTHDVLQLAAHRARRSQFPLTEELIGEIIATSRPVNFLGRNYYEPRLTRQALDENLPDISGMRYITLADARRYVLGTSRQEFGVKLKRYEARELVELGSRYTLNENKIMAEKLGPFVDKKELHSLIKLMLRDVYSVKGLKIPQQYRALDYQTMHDEKLGYAHRFGRSGKSMAVKMEAVWEEELHRRAEEYALAHPEE